MKDRPKGYRDVPGIIGPDEVEEENTASSDSDPIPVDSGEAEPSDEDAPSESAATSEADSAPRALARRGANDIWRLLMQHLGRHLPTPSPPTPKHIAPPPRLVGRIGKIIPFMQTIPWVLAAGFAVSFWWDFPGMTLAVPGAVLPLEGLLRILSVSGLIGFGTNWLAITMLFRPREKRPILPQGLIPQQRDRVIYRLGEAISRELINEQIIQERIRESGIITRYRDAAVRMVQEVIDDPDFRSDLKDLTAHYVEEALTTGAVREQLSRIAVEKIETQVGEGFAGLAFRLYRSLREGDFERRIDRALADLPNALNPLLDKLDASLDRLPDYFESQAPALEELATRTVLDFVGRFDVRAMIISKATAFDEHELERLLKSTSNEQLNYIKYLGGILGVIGGLVIWQPVSSLIVLGTLTALILGLDEGLHRLGQQRAAASTDESQ